MTGVERMRRCVSSIRRRHQRVLWQLGRQVKPRHIPAEVFEEVQAQIAREALGRIVYRGGQHLVTCEGTHHEVIDLAGHVLEQVACWCLQELQRQGKTTNAAQEEQRGAR